MNRSFLPIALILLALGIGGTTGLRAADETRALTPTPSNIEGPYFKAGSPPRSSLVESGIPGKRLVLSGRVLSVSGTPIGNVRLDFWQADGNGHYDNEDSRLRGHQFTDNNGRYALETMIPGMYPGRTPHIHVKVQAPGRPALTTQLYFPDQTHNRSDALYFPELQVQPRDTPNGSEATFDFVLQ